MKNYNKSAFTVGALVIILSLVLAACNPASSGAAKFPIGRFVSVSDQSNEYEFNKDKTWSYYQGGLMAAKGTYQVEGNLYIDQGTPECPFKGTYQWSYDGKNLSFKLVGEDACEPRKAATDGQTLVLSQ